MSLPSIGIAIANYNKAPYVRECLESVLSQDYPNLKVVIVDDASNDPSAKILDAYAQQYSNCDLIRNSKNLGVAKSRNLAIKALQTDWISTLDSDDFYCHHKKLSLELEAASGYTEYEGVGFSSFVLVDEHGSPLPWLHAAKAICEGDVFEAILTRSAFIPRDVLFPRAAIEKIGGFDPSIPIYEDWDFKLRLARMYSFHYTGIEGIAYRQTNRGLSTTSRRKHERWLRAVFERYVRYAQNQEELRMEFEQIVPKSRWKRTLENLQPRRNP